MSDASTPNLPSSDFEKTFGFYWLLALPKHRVIRAG